MKKIILITPYPNKDDIHGGTTGVGSYSKFLVDSLLAYINVEIWAQKSENLKDFEETLPNKNRLAVFRIWTKNLSGIFSIIKKIWADRPQMIHVQQELSMFDSVITFPFSVLIFLIPRLLGTKVITTMHGGFSISQVDANFVKENGYNLPPFIIRLAFYFSFGIIAHSSSKIIVHEDWQKEDLVKDYKVSKNKIFVIPHGVPEHVEIFDNLKTREIFKIEQYKKVFLYMGFAAKYKGLPEMLNIYKNYIKHNPNTLLIIGAGPAPRLKNNESYMNWYKLLKMEYEELNKEGKENVRWVGFIPTEEVSKYYSIADAVVLPYSRRIAASGPMAIAIGYEKDIILSSILKGEKAFSFSFDNKIKTPDLKAERMWATVAENTIKLYKK